MSLFDFSYLFPNSIEEVDKFNGKQFEVFLFEFFNVLGYAPRLTDDTYDKGIDLIIKMPRGKDIINVGIQAKRWKSKVGADEIRSMLDGKGHYNLDEVWIITTSALTSAATTTAKNNRIEILTRDNVKDFLGELSKFDVKFTEKTKLSEYRTTTTIVTSNEILFNELRDLRIKISKENKIYPVYLVYNNKVIEELIKDSPKTKEELSKVKGMQEKIVDSFHEEILNIINKPNDLKLRQELINIRIKVYKYNKLKNEYDVFDDTVLNKLLINLPKSLEELIEGKLFNKEQVKLFGDYLIREFNKH